MPRMTRACIGHPPTPPARMPHAARHTHARIHRPTAHVRMTLELRAPSPLLHPLSSWNRAGACQQGATGIDQRPAPTPVAVVAAFLAALALPRGAVGQRAAAVLERVAGHRLAAEVDGLARRRACRCNGRLRLALAPRPLRRARQIEHRLQRRQRCAARGRGVHRCLRARVMMPSQAHMLHGWPVITGLSPNACQCDAPSCQGDHELPSRSTSTRSQASPRTLSATQKLADRASRRSLSDLAPDLPRHPAPCARARG